VLEATIGNIRRLGEHISSDVDRLHGIERDYNEITKKIQGMRSLFGL
jgi:hypothetical protein